MDLGLHIAHLERAAPEDRPALIQRIAALAWREGHGAGIDQGPTDPEASNPYSEE